MTLAARLRELTARWGLGSGLARGAVLAFAIQVTGVALAYLLHVLLARWMGSAEYGAYTYALAWVTTLAIFATLGMDAAVLRFAAEYRAMESWRSLRGLLSSFWWLGLGSAIVLALATAGVAVLVASGERRVEILLGLTLLPPLTLLGLQREAARGLGWVVLSQAPQRVVRPGLLLAAAAAALAAGVDLDSRTVLVLTLLTLVIVVVGQGVQMLSSLPRAVVEAAPRRSLGAWMAVALSLLLSTGFTVLLTQMDLLMVGIFRSDVEVGRYNAAAKTAILVTFVTYAINVAAAPRFAALYAQGRRGELQALVARLAHWAFWPSLALTLVLSVLATPILALFGNDFRGVRWELRILALGHLFGAGIGSVGYLLNQCGFERANARASLGAVALGLVLNGLLIPPFGTLGAAVATAITWAALMLGLRWAVVRRVGVRPSIVEALSVSRRRRES